MLRYCELCEKEVEPVEKDVTVSFECKETRYYCPECDYEFSPNFRGEDDDDRRMPLA